MKKCFKSMMCTVLVKLVYFSIAVAVALWASTDTLLASDDIVVQLRFYQGLNENGSSSGVIVSSYYQKKTSDDTVFSFVEIDKETQKLKEIYKLKGVKPIGNYDLVLKNNKAIKIYTTIEMSGKKLGFRLAPVLDQKDRFGIKIFTGEDEKLLMESDIVIPEEKTAVLGFKDSEEKIYFVAFNRKKESDFSILNNSKTVESPKLINRVEPTYPTVLAKEKLQGEVVLIGQTDLEGKVIDAQVLKGHPLLNAMTLAAVRKWVYTPWKIDGITKTVDFSMIFMYRQTRSTGEAFKKDCDAVMKKYNSLLKEYKPQNGIPRIMELVTVIGEKNPPDAPDSPKEPQEPTLAQQLHAQTVESPKLIRRPEPVYPEKALQSKIQGNVVLQLVTDNAGKTVAVKALSGHPQLVEAATANILKWKYTPWIIDGAVKPVEANIIVIFRLKIKTADEIDAQVDAALKANADVLGKRKPAGQIPRLMEVVVVEGEE